MKSKTLLVTAVSLALMGLSQGVYAKSLSIGNNYLYSQSGEISEIHKIDLSYTGLVSVTLYPRDDIDMNIHLDNAPKQASKDLSKVHCAPKSKGTKTETCYLNLESSKPFYLQLKNASSRDSISNVKITKLYCSPSWSGDWLTLCPVTDSQRKLSTHHKDGINAWEQNWWTRVIPSNDATHKGVDKYADDINWGNGWEDNHRGLYASISGQVIFRGNVNDWGNQVIIYDKNLKIAVRYAHLDSMNVSEGNYVTTQSKIGTLGNTGNSSAPHLHLSVYKNIDSTAISNLSRGSTPHGKGLDVGNYSKYVTKFKFKYSIPQKN